MSFARTLICCLLALSAAGCKAQTAAASLPPLTSQQSRRIEVLVRNQFQVASDVNVSLGTVAKADFPGYATLPITFSDGHDSTTVNFLISDDGKTLVRLQKLDLTRDPADAISTAGRPVRGPASAKVEIVNFDDLECPYCAQLHSQFFPATADRYKDLVKFVYKDYPLVEIHPWAMHAAVDANCLASLNDTAYWNFVDYVHTHLDEISGTGHDPKAIFPVLDRQALSEGQAAKVDPVKLAACVEKQDQSSIEASLREGKALDIDGTPTFYVNGERVVGIESTKQLWSVIDRALKAEGIQPPPPAPADNKNSAAAASASPQQSK